VQLYSRDFREIYWVVVEIAGVLEENHQLWAHPARLLQRIRYPKTIRIHLRLSQNKLSPFPTASRLVVEECSQVQICCSPGSGLSCSTHRPLLSY